VNFQYAKKTGRKLNELGRNPVRHSTSNYFLCKIQHCCSG